MRLWIDDVRAPPSDEWTWAKNSKIAMAQIGSHFIGSKNAGQIPAFTISFDHDLGGDDTTMVVARHFEELAFKGIDFQLEWAIHSANPVGRKNLEYTLLAVEKWQEMHKKHPGVKIG